MKILTLAETINQRRNLGAGATAGGARPGRPRGFPQGPETVRRPGTGGPPPGSARAVSVPAG
ncbi:hypothetical protein RZS08_31020, partial [Arthrospira platensis SPKY1]|nr:hypothetical protein [Arthrospira platensis SPKY1]